MIEFTDRPYTQAEREAYAPLIRSRALAYAGSKRFVTVEDAEDFGSFAVIEYLSKGRHEMKWLFVDWLRTFSGRKGRCPGYEARILLHNANFEDASETLASLSDGGAEAHDNARDAYSLLKLVKNPQHKDVLLLWVEGLKQAEIGRLLELTESRVSQIVHTAIRDIRRQIGVRVEEEPVEYFEAHGQTGTLET